MDKYGCGLFGSLENETTFKMEKFVYQKYIYLFFLSIISTKSKTFKKLKIKTEQAKEARPTGCRQ